MYGRPNFATPADYCRHVASFLEKGWQPWEPATVGELMAALEQFPQDRWRFEPGPEVMDLMGIPRDYGLEPKEFPERFQERFLQTLKSDKAFAQAVVNLLREAAA